MITQQKQMMGMLLGAIQIHNLFYYNCLLNMKWFSVATYYIMWTTFVVIITDVLYK